MPTLKKRYVFLNILIAVITFLLQFNNVFITNNLSFYPIFPLGFLVVISMFSTELHAVVIGLIMGVFIDCAVSTSYSFNTIVYPIVAFLIALTSHYLFNKNVLTCIMLSFLSVIFVSGAESLVFYFSSGFRNLLENFLKTDIPSALLTVVFSVILFYIENKIFKTLR